MPAHPDDRLSRPTTRARSQETEEIATGQEDQLAGWRFDIPNPKDETPQTYGEISEPHVDYCRDDVRATMQLYEALMLEQYKHDMDLPEHVTYSPASLAKGYFDKVGLRRPLEKITDIPQKVLGYAMTAFFGGRSEVMIRRTPVPAVLCDFTSMYPTVNALMRLWDLLRADDITAKPDTEAVRCLLTRVTLDNVFDPGMWPEFVGIAKVRLNGDVVPVRSDYGAGNTTIGLNYAYDDERWYAIPDLVASTLLTGKVPDVVEAYRFYPAGNMDRLRPITFHGVPFDPRDDLFAYLVERRNELKTAHSKVCADVSTE